MSQSKYKRLIVIARGLPCDKRTKFVGKFAPTDVLAPAFGSTPMTSNASGVTNRSALERRSATDTQEDLFLLTILTTCQTQKTMFVIDADLIDQKKVIDIQNIGAMFGYGIKIITFTPDNLPVLAPNSASNIGVHLFGTRMVDYQALSMALSTQKRLSNEKWVRIKLDSNYSVVESTKHDITRAIHT